MKLRVWKRLPETERRLSALLSLPAYREKFGYLHCADWPALRAQFAREGVNYVAAVVKKGAAVVFSQQGEVKLGIDVTDHAAALMVGLAVMNGSETIEVSPGWLAECVALEFPME